MSLDRTIIAAAVLVAAVAGGVAVQAQRRSAADAFRVKLLAALADHRRHDVAALFKYPARVPPRRLLWRSGQLRADDRGA